MTALTPGIEPATRSDAVPRPLLILISAPSGAGKTTLCRQLLAARPDMVRAVTCTTRPPRAGERQGVDYHFLDSAAFSRLIDQDAFLEHAMVYGNRYGTLRSEIADQLKRGKDVLLSVDVQGAASLQERAREDAELSRALVTVFLAPPSMKALEERLRKRGTDSQTIIEKRLRVARQENACWRQFGYLLRSSTVEEDLRRMLAIVDAEKMRSSRNQPPEL